MKSYGYEIPRHKNKKGILSVKRGTKILVKIKDLPKCSEVKVKVKCDCCDKEYEIQYKDYIKYNHNEKIYCNKCANKIFNSGENHANYGGKYSKKGENNPSWNPNKTDEERTLKRQYPEYTEFIKKVLKRDNYTCQCCGKHNNDIQVHHLDGYNWCKEKRTDETNGITLCQSCHKNFHSIYGTGNNTKEQFEEWIGKAIELAKYEGELPTARKVYCIEEDKIYDSAEQLIREWNLTRNSDIYNICNHKKRSNNSYYKSVKGKHILWLDEYEQMSEEDLKRYLDWCNDKKLNYKKIKCITTNEEFDSIKEASIKYGISTSNIVQCCKGKRNKAGQMEWEYI